MNINCSIYLIFSFHLDSREALLGKVIMQFLQVLEFLKLYDSDIPYGNQLFGKVITIINRSEVVGRPLAALLDNDGATVYSVDIHDILRFVRGQGLRKHVVS